MIDSIFSIGDEALFKAVLEAYGSLFEASELPYIKELQPDEKPSYNSYRYVENTPDKKTVRLYTYDSNNKPYVVIVQARKVPEQLANALGGGNIVTVNFAKDKSGSFKATGDGGIKAASAIGGMMRQLVEEIGADGLTYIPSGGDEAENAKKKRVYANYFSKFLPEFKPLPKDQIPPQQAAMGMEVRMR